MAARNALLLVLAASLALGCEGLLGDGPSGPRGGGSRGPGDPLPPIERPPIPEEPPYQPPSFECRAERPRTGATPRVWRLSAAQYEATIREAWGRFRAGDTLRTPPFLAPFADTNPADRFGTYALSYGMSDDELVTALETGRTLAADFVRQFRGVDRWGNYGSGCTTSSDVRDCVRRMAAELGGVLYRRPLSSDELDELVVTYDEAATVSHDTGLETVVRRLLTAPQFLYRDEVARGPDRRLDAHQVAAALSYTIRSGPPSRQLEAASRTDDFLSEASLRAAVAEMLGADLASQPRVLRFLHEYTRTPALPLVFKDPAQHGWYNEQRALSSADAFFRHVLATHGRDGLFEALLTDPSVFVNQDSYRFFFPDDEESRARWRGVSTPERVELPDQRRGFLTQPAWLVTHSHADETHPVGRGHFIADAMLCVTIPPVPIGVVAVLPDTPGATMRERLSEHSREECSACHSLMDDAGLALEVFDHLGRHRETEHGRSIETAGVLRGRTEAHPFTDTLALIDAIAASRDARECFVLRNFEYWLGRRATQDDGCTLVSMYDALFETRDYVEMLQVMFTSDSFLAQQEVSE